MKITKSEGSIDIITFGLYLTLIFVGWMLVFAVNYDGKLHTSAFDMSVNTGRQFIWVMVSLMIIGVTFIIPVHFWRGLSYFFYLFSLLLLVGVLIFGKEINGAKAWYSFGAFSFQPVEFTKFATAIALSTFMSAPGFKINDSKSVMAAIGIFLFPVILIIFQPDAGSCLVFLSFFLLLYREGLNPVYYYIFFLCIAGFVGSLILGLYNSTIVLIFFTILASSFYIREKIIPIASLIIFIAVYFFFYSEANFFYLLGFYLALLGINLFLAWKNRAPKDLVLILFTFIGLNIISLGANLIFEFLKPHQQERINVWLHPEKCDPKGSLYNVLQSKMAIGSGGFSGKGFLEGTMTKLNYVPEQSTDFIYCTVGEEFGFIGTGFIIFLFILLITRIIILAERQKLNFAKNYGYCIAGILFIHIFINISMTIGLMPIIGIPLPFLSYGGSSMMGFSLLLGVFLKMDYSRQIR
jgi:rod shape determining protein RodA